MLRSETEPESLAPTKLWRVEFALGYADICCASDFRRTQMGTCRGLRTARRPSGPCIGCSASSVSVKTSYFSEGALLAYCQVSPTVLTLVRRRWRHTSNFLAAS